MARASKATADVLVQCVRRPERRSGNLALRLADVDLGALGALALEHRVAGVVRDALRQNGTAGEAGVLAGEDVRATVGHLRALEDLAVAANALDGAGLDWLVVKGPVLSEHVYRQPARRTYRDLDLVVPPAGLPDAMAALRAAGGTVVDRNWPLSRRLLLGEVNLALPFGTPGDLHWHLLNDRDLRREFLVPMASLFDRAERIPLAGTMVATTDMVDTLLHLCLHAAMAGGTRLAMLKDIDELVSNQDPDWDEVVRRARAWRVGVVVATMIGRAGTTLATPLPRGVVRRLAGGRVWPALARVNDLAYPAARTTGRGPARLVARSTRRSTVGSVRELGRRSLAAALRRSSLDEIEAERKDPSNPQSVLYPAGGDLDLERYFAALADLDEHGNPPVAVLRGRRHAGTADVAARSMIVVLNLPVPDDRRVWAEACALLEAGDAVTVICPALRGHRPGWATVDGIDVRYFRTFEGGGSLSTVAEGLWTTGAATLIGTALLRRHPFDVVQVCNPPDSLGPFLRLAARTGARTVYDQHDVVPVLASEKISFRGAAKLFAAMERSTIRSAEVVISPSGEQARRIDDLYGRGVSVVRTASVEVAPRGTRPDVGPLRLGYLGVVGSQDGLDDAVRAVAETRARSNVDFEVRIAGDGPSLPSARALAAELGLQDTIRFVGWLDHARVGAFLEGIDAMLVPDPPTPFNHLCAMNKVTHAMAAGICIIYRPLRENLDLTGGLAYVAKGEGVGHFAEAIVQFLSAPPRERADVGAELAARFHKLHAWPVHKARYLEAVRGPVPAAPGVRSDA